MTGPALPTRLAKKVARTPVELARWLRTLSRRAPREAEDYLVEHATDWLAVAQASPEDAADILEAIGTEAAGGLIADLEPDRAAELFEEMRDEMAASLLSELPVGEGVERIRQLHDDYEDLSYVYVVDDYHRLLGMVSFRDLIFHRPGDGLDQAMGPDQIAVPPLPTGQRRPTWCSDTTSSEYQLSTTSSASSA